MNEQQLRIELGNAETESKRLKTELEQTTKHFEVAVELTEKAVDENFNRKLVEIPKLEAEVERLKEELDGMVRDNTKLSLQFAEERVQREASAQAAMDMVADLGSQIATERVRVEKYHEALKHIKDDLGKVCLEYEVCTHSACADSYAAWAIAVEALAADEVAP